eukprot:CAMPEP_0178920910 /NCGR_PEP_ID=MMETSP0786-20121207/15265_1 /TAXON_ID=186022 /ORGANISM="Thalassionema frauenfeldii, Strain CCMP 1798" /LENGTH=323 /DNA_ID=CAMNT_0020595025 /DNA_START=169 /DNA_END=1140 /DNA_ORIENTATION=-
MEELSQEQQPSAAEIFCGDLDSTSGDDLASIDSLSTVDDDVFSDEPLFVTEQVTNMLSHEKAPEGVKNASYDVNKYMEDREMSPIQERWNAITILPNPFFCMYFILAGLWISQDLKNQFHDVEIIHDSRCIQWEWFPNLVAIPPAPILAVMIGITLHAPFSFLYHWKCASILPPGIRRTTHWSRRMDHSMIHVASTFLSFATSGSWDYFIVNALFSADCIYRQFKKKVRPHVNQIRIGLSLVAYSLPILKRGEFSVFFKCWTILFTAGYFFVRYPVGGWSHSVFHIILAFMPPYLMQVASTLPTSREYMEVAAQCAVLAERAM